MLWWTLAKLEPWIRDTRLRKAALAEVMRHVHFEVCMEALPCVCVRMTPLPRPPASAGRPERMSTSGNWRTRQPSPAHTLWRKFEWQRQQKSQPCAGWTFHKSHTRCCHNSSSFSVAVVQDENTRYIDIGPVNKTINTLACWFENPDGEPFKRCALALVEVFRSLGSAPSITHLVEARVSCG